MSGFYLILGGAEGSQCPKTDAGSQLLQGIDWKHQLLLQR